MLQLREYTCIVTGFWGMFNFGTPYFEQLVTNPDFYGRIFVHRRAPNPPPTNHNPTNQFLHLIEHHLPWDAIYLCSDYIYILLCTYFRYYVYRRPGVFWPMIWQAGEWGYSWKYFAEILQLNRCFLSRMTALMNCTMMSSSEVTRQGK